MPRHSRGFSFIEVLVAVGVLASMIVATGALMRGALLSESVKHQDLALKIATNELETLRGSGYANISTTTTTFADALISSLPSGSGRLTITDYNTKTRKVIVNVYWLERGATASSTVSLTTLVTQIGGLP